MGNRYKRLPRLVPSTVKGRHYDFARIKTEYMESEIIEWVEYCRSKNYNPYLDDFPWKKWVREKKSRNARIAIRADLENEGSLMGPTLLLKQVRAVRQVPELAAAFMQLIAHMVHIHQLEARHDQRLIADAATRGTTPNRAEFQLGLTHAECRSLSTAIKQTSEVLYNSLGIDSSAGVQAQKWIQLVEMELSQTEFTLTDEKTMNPLQIEVLGGGDMRQMIAETMEKYLDKPGAPEQLDAAERPEGMDDDEEGELIDDEPVSES